MTAARCTLDDSALAMAGTGPAGTAAVRITADRRGLSARELNTGASGSSDPVCWLESNNVEADVSAGAE